MPLKLLISLLILFNAGLVSAMSSSNYAISVSDCNQGGGGRVGGQYRIDDNVGQGVIADIKSNNYNLSIGLIPVLLPQPLQYGSLSITSTPLGAKIYLNGSDTGFVTTHTFTNISAGTQTIKLTLSGYNDWYGTATVTAGLTTYIYATMTQTYEPNLDKALVYPNPYDADKHAGIGITFDELSENSTIQIFTIAGELVREIRVDRSRMSWDARNSAGERVASGIYIYLIKDSNGNKKSGKLGILR